jgi:hypothetical protein
MRINDLLIESTNQLNEGPKFNKFGKAIGNVAGMAAKGVGAVAGGIAGLGAAAKKGFQAGKSQVAAADDGAAPAGKPAAKPGVAPAAGGTSTKPKGFIAGVKAGQSQGLSALNDPSADDEDPTAVGAQVTPAGATTAGGIVQPPPAPAAKPQAGATTPPSATDINKAGPKGTAQAKPIQGTVAKQAAAKTGAALAGQDQAQAGQTMYSQVKANIDKLDKKGKQRILQLLQKSLTAPEAKPAAGGAMGQMAGQLAKGGAAPNTMANAPVSKTNTAKSGNPNAAAPTGNYDGKTGAPLSDKAKADAEFDASPEGKAMQAKVDAMGSNPASTKKRTTKKAQPEMAGKVNNGSLVLEGFSLFRKK